MAGHHGREIGRAMGVGGDRASLSRSFKSLFDQELCKTLICLKFDCVGRTSVLHGNFRSRVEEFCLECQQ